MGDMFGDVLTAVRERELPVSGDVVIELVALQQAVASRLAEAVDELDRSALWELDGATSVTAWLKDRAELSPRQAGRVVAQARERRRFPVTVRAVASGELTPGQGDVIAQLATPEWAEHEAAVVPSLVGLSVEETQVAMRHWKSLLDQPVAEPPTDHVHLQPVGDGWDLRGTLGGESGAVVDKALELAETYDGLEETRLKSERVANALVDVCRFFLDHQHIKPGGRNRPHLNIICDLDRLDRGGETFDGMRITGADLSTLLCDSTVSRVLTMGRREVLEVGRASRTVTVALWLALGVRDRHCRFPGCDRKPQWCDAHHIVFWEHGGETILENLVLLCSRHHHLIHRQRIAAKLLPDGTFEITWPDGRHRSSTLLRT